MTINDQAGSGKSTLINTIVTILRQMFQFNDIVHVLSPTGGAAYSAGGQTIHEFFNCDENVYSNKPLVTTTNERLDYILQSTVCLIFDERSLISSALLGAAEHKAKTHAHRGINKEQSWDGIPIVLFVGDDYQLPSISRGVLSLQFDYTEEEEANNYKNCAPPNTIIQSRGEMLFLESTETVMQLDSSKRINDDQPTFRNLQLKMRYDNLNQDDFDELYKYYLENGSFSKQQIEDLKKNSMFLYANKEPRDDHNMVILKQISSQTNPVGIVHSHSDSDYPGKMKGISSHFKTIATAPTISLL